MRYALAALALLLATLAPAAPSDEGVPGRDGSYELAGSNVEGTMWEGNTDRGVFIVRFERGGMLCYTSPSGTFRNGTWTQNGNVILLEMNGHYADYRGEMRGDRILGEASNKPGMKWNWNVKRKGPIVIEERDKIIPRKK